MARSLFKVSSLLALIAIGACGASDVKPTGAGGSAAAGNAGTMGAAGAAGTTGAAGTAGTTGAGGTNSSAGTTGSAGVTGGGGAGGCTITATSTLGTIPTVGIVTFTTSATGVTAAEIRFGLVSTGPTMTAPVDLTQASYRTLLLGMKGSSDYVYRIVVTSSAGTCASQDYTVTTGAVPSSVTRPTTVIMNASAHFKGFLVTTTPNSSGTSGSSALIYDADGDPVWWATAPDQASRAQISWDGSKMYAMSLNVQNAGAGRINIVNMDGSGATVVSDMTASHHDMTAIPGGLATLMWNATGVDAPCSLVERADDGTKTTIVADMTSVYSSPNNRYHTNSVHYYPADNTYTLGDRNPSMYVKVTRAGQLVWQFGGGSAKDPSKFFSGVPTWMVNHGHHLRADGSFILFNNGSSLDASAVVRAFKLNTTDMTATSTLTYMAGIASLVMGDAQFLPSGNILVTFSRSGADPRGHVRRPAGGDIQGDVVRLHRVSRFAVRPAAPVAPEPASGSGRAQSVARSTTASQWDSVVRLSPCATAAGSDGDRPLSNRSVFIGARDPEDTRARAPLWAARSFLC